MNRTGLRSRRGFSLVEVLIGSVFLMVIVLSVLILFTHSMVSNESGATYSDITNLARSRVEHLNQMPFNGSDLTIDSGSEKLFQRYYSANEKRWIEGPPPEDGSDHAVWISSTTVRQYNNNAWEDGTLESQEALESGTPSEFVHFKEILVQVENGDRLGLLGPARRVTLRSLISK